MPQDVAGHEGPHPPPAPAMGMVPPPGPLETAANIDTCFFAGDWQLGHATALSDSLKEQRRSNLWLHSEHLYSYIGMANTF